MNELLGRVRVLWNGLAAREQVLVGVAGGLVAVLLLVFGIVLPVVAATERAVEDADTAERQLAIMQRMKREWDGLHRRLDELKRHHDDRLDQFQDACTGTMTAMDLSNAIFTKPMDSQNITFAIGETVAHLNYLRARGSITRETRHDGVFLYDRA